MGNLQDSNRDAAFAADTTGPGQRLRVAREARQLTRDAVAVQLRVEPKVIDALEHDDYAQLPAAVFVRGYLRAYSRLVGLVAEPLIEAFDKRTAHTPPPLVLPTAIGPDIESRRGYARGIVIALALLSLLLFYQWWRLEGSAPPADKVPQASLAQPSQPIQTVSEPPASVPTPAPGVPLESLYETPPDESGLSAQTESVPAAQPAQTEATTAIESKPAPVTAAAPADIATAPAKSVTEPPQAATPEAAADAVPVDGAAPLVLQFNDDCWVVIRDASGQALLQGLIKAGARHALEGKPPFEVTLGNSPAVEIEYLGQHFDQSRYTGASRIARFTLGK